MKRTALLKLASLTAATCMQIACAQPRVTTSSDIHLSSFCNVVGSPVDYDGRLIRLQGTAKPPDHAPLHLVSEGCEQTIFLDPDAIKDDPNLVILEQSVWRGFPEESAGVAVDVVGKFRWAKGRGVLVLREIIRVGDGAREQAQ